MVIMNYGMGGNTIPALENGNSVTISSSGATVHAPGGSTASVSTATYMEDVANYSPPASSSGPVSTSPPSAAVSATNSNSGATVNAALPPAPGSDGAYFVASPALPITIAVLAALAYWRWG